MSAELRAFLDWRCAQRGLSRAELEQLIGRTEVQRLLAAGLLAENPFTERIEAAAGTEDFYP